MSRSLDSAVATGIAQTVVPVVFFSEFEFASTTLRMWSGVGDKVWDGHTWTGAGDSGGMSPIDEVAEIGAAGMTFSLSGVPTASRALALGDAYRNRPCRSWLAICDADWNVLGAYKWYGGRMDVLAIKGHGTESTITIQAENRLIDLFRARSSRYTNAEQLRRAPGDTSLSRIAKLPERPLPWGVPAQTSAPAAAEPNYTSSSFAGYSGGSRPGVDW